VASVPVPHAAALLEAVRNAPHSVEVVAIDEAQFFDEALPLACLELANQGKRVIVCGLDMDFEGRPFGSMPALMSMAEFVTKLHAICMQCGDLANYSYRIGQAQETVLLGEKDQYEARCRRCFLEGNRQKESQRQAFASSSHNP
jgi:thymidine kinase